MSLAKTESRWCSRAALAVALLVAVLQTVGPNIRSPLEIDEQVSYYIACGKTPATVFARSQEQSATPPLFFWLARASFVLGQRTGDWPSREFWLRFPSWVSFLLVVYFLYRFGEREIRVGAGGPAALVGALHPLVVHYALVARPYMLGIFENLLAGYFLCELRRRNGRVVELAGFTIAIAGLAWTHYVFPVVWAALFALLFLLPRDRNHQLSENFVNSGGAQLPSVWLLLGLFGLGIAIAAPLVGGFLRVSQLGPVLNWITELPSAATLLTWVRPPMLFATFAAAVGLSLAERLIRGRKETRSAISVRILFCLLVWSLIPAAVIWWAAQSAPALAQLRYLVIGVCPAILLLVGLLAKAFSPGVVTASIVIGLCVDGAAVRVVGRLEQPVHHDSFWLDAAATLNRLASKNDLVLVHSGLVETRLMPAAYDDLGFQEYTTSRLSDFYFHAGARRLTLPGVWRSGAWQSYYDRIIDQTLANGGVIWTVISADSDLGENVERETITWLSQKGLLAETISSERVARIFRYSRPESK